MLIINKISGKKFKEALGLKMVAFFLFPPLSKNPNKKIVQ